MSRADRIGLAALVLGAFGVGITILYPQARILGWLFIVIGFGGCAYWGKTEIGEWLQKRDQSIAARVLAGNLPAKESPKPNLVSYAIKYGGFAVNNGTWTRNTYPDQVSYRGIMLAIKNEPIPGKQVGDAVKLSAQVIISRGGGHLCSATPAPWAEEPLNTVTIPHGAEKNLILAVCQGGAGGYWEVVTDHRHDSSSTQWETVPIPYQFDGELKIRLLSNGLLLKTEFFTWRRDTATNFLDIRLRTQAAS